MKNIKIIVSFILSWLIVIGAGVLQFGASEVTVSAQSDLIGDMATVSETEIPKELSSFSNIVTEVYPNAFGDKRNTFLSLLESGDYQVVVYYEKLYILTYSRSYELKSWKTIELELPVWGGYFSGAKSNFVICGQGRDSSQPDGGEVYRIIKYDKEFNRLDSLSINSMDSYTAYPFDASNVSVAEYEDTLVVYSGRLRLDGHQSNVAIKVNIENMNEYAVNSDYPYPYDHVSHSFRQIVKFDGDNPVFVDLSDHYPQRSVYLQSTFGRTALLDVPGADGDNVTNTEVSGLEFSPSHYFVVGSQITNYTSNEIFLAIYNKERCTTEVKWLTVSSAFYSDGIYGNPRITKLDDNKFVVIWSRNKDLEYVIIDGAGNVIDGVNVILSLNLSDCEPVYVNNAVRFVNIDNGRLSFIAIDDLNGMESTLSTSDELVSSNAFWDGSVDTSWYSSVEDEFSLSTPAQLAGLALLVNDGNDFAQKRINLIDDVFMHAEAYQYNNMWIPIGNRIEYAFNGIFNGNGHSIYNMFVDESQDGGLFGFIGEQGLVKAVNMKQGWFEAGGCIADSNSGKIMYCNSYSIVCEYDSNYLASGGICNNNEGLVYGCKNYGTVDGQCMGGIVGINRQRESTVSSCANYGLVMATSTIGGISVYNYGWIYDCYNVGILSGGFGLNIGNRFYGISDNNSSSENNISNCYNAGYMFTSELQWYYPVSSDYDNCYVWENISGVNKEHYLDILFDMEDVYSGVLMKDLNTCFNNMIVSAWREDTENINNGFPITIADYNYSQGIYKMVPEIWGKSEISVNDVCEKSYSLYFCEVAPEVEIENSNIADVISDVSANSINLVITGKEVGSTTLAIHFKETENNCEFVFKILVTVNTVLMPETSEPESNDPTEVTYLIGDANSDGKINVKDATQIQKAVAGLVTLDDVQTLAADSDQNEKVNVKDATAIQKHVAGIDTGFLIETPVSVKNATEDKVAFIDEKILLY